MNLESKYLMDKSELKYNELKYKVKLKGRSKVGEPVLLLKT